MLRQRQLLLDLVDHAAPAGVDAEVLEGRLEVGHVRLDLHAQHLRACSGVSQAAGTGRAALPHQAGEELAARGAHPGTCEHARRGGSLARPARKQRKARRSWRTLRANRLATKTTISDTGSTRGARVVMLAFSDLPAMAISCLLSSTPTCPAQAAACEHAAAAELLCSL